MKEHIVETLKEAITPPEGLVALLQREPPENPQTITHPMPYQQCLDVLQKLKTTRTVSNDIVTTGIVRTTRFDFGPGDGGVLVTASKLDNQLSFTRTPNEAGSDGVLR